MPDHDNPTDERDITVSEIVAVDHDNDPDKYTRVTRVTSKHFPPTEKWYDRDHLAKLEAESERAWSQLSDEQQQAWVIIVRDSLLQLAQNPADWLPISMVPKTGHKVDVWLGFDLDEIEGEVLRRRRAAEQRLVETRRDLRKMREGFVQRSSNGSEGADI